MFPPFALIWLIGWSLYLTGSRKKIKPKKIINKANEAIFAVLIPEEKYAT